MALDNSPERTWWILQGTPKGPFTDDTVRSRLSAGEIAPDTPICLVGGEQWVPASSWLESHGVHTPAKAPPISGYEGSPPSEQSRSGGSHSQVTQQPARKWLARAWNAVAIVTLVLALFEWVRPPTPREVTKRALTSGSAEQMKRHTAPTIHPQVDAIFSAVPGGELISNLEFLEEGSLHLDEFVLLSFRGNCQIGSTGNRRPIQGHVSLKRSKGWKVDGISVWRMDNAPLATPVSLGELLSNGTLSQPSSRPNP